MRTLLDRRQGLFYDPYETYSESERLRHRVEKLDSIIAHAKQNSPFYRDRLRDVPFQSEDLNPLARFPILKADDLRTLVPPQGRDLLTENSTAFTVFQSGGTTGVPKTSLFTHEEMELINDCNARGFFATGLEATDRVANLWAVGGLYMTFIHMNRMLQEYGCTSFPFSNQTPADFILTVAKLFNINVFTGITSVVLNTLREIDRKEKNAFKVKKIYFGGEHIYENDRIEMQEKFGLELIAAPGYGTVDSWYLGYQCKALGNGVFHAFDDMVYLEILDESNEVTGGNPVARGETGMLYVTAYYRKLTPIVRFRVGDRARWLKESCTCGRTTPLFELLGRGDDVLRIGYDSVDYAYVQTLLPKVRGASGRMQMEKRRKGGRDELIIRVETGEPESRYAEMSRTFEETFLNERPSFREFIKKETIWPLKIEWIREGALPQNPRTGKLIRVIDAIADAGSATAKKGGDA